jgi:hypothetical protein
MAKKIFSFKQTFPKASGIIINVVFLDENKYMYGI